MTRLASKLALAAVLAAALPAAAGARPCDDPRRDDPRYPEQALPAPYYPPAAPPPMPAGWGRNGWRERDRALREIDRELYVLEARRAAFYQRRGWHERKVRRFERWYASERAELERRRDELQHYAWR